LQKLPRAQNTGTFYYYFLLKRNYKGYHLLQPRRRKVPCPGAIRYGLMMDGAGDFWDLCFMVSLLLCVHSVDVFASLVVVGVIVS
jgi:hypothetical protein